MPQRLLAVIHIETCFWRASWRANNCAPEPILARGTLVVQGEDFRVLGFNSVP